MTEITLISLSTDDAHSLVTDEQRTIVVGDLLLGWYTCNGVRSYSNKLIFRDSIYPVLRELDRIAESAPRWFFFRSQTQRTAGLLRDVLLTQSNNPNGYTMAAMLGIIRQGSQRDVLCLFEPLSTETEA